MPLHYLDFDYSEDDEGVGTWDAMASVTPQHLPALLAELEQVLDWAHQFCGRHAPIDDGGDWDFDLQILCDEAAPHQLVYDQRSGKIAITPGTTLARYTLSLALSGRAAFGSALCAHFDIA
jgi:hypothetical protein